MITVIRTTTTTTHLGVTEFRVRLISDSYDKPYFSLELLGPISYGAKKGKEEGLQTVVIEPYDTNVALVARLLELTGPGPVKL